MSDSLRTTDGPQVLVALFAVTLLALLLPFASCSLKSTPNSAKTAQTDEEDEDEEDDDEADEQIGPPFPTQASAWHTRMLIASNPQPTAERVHGCIEQLSQISAESANQQDMMAAQSQITTLAANDPDLYHYCFFQLMVRLDDRLAVGGPLMSEVATSFFDSMRALWIMARGLDALTGRTRYFDYLQRRYVQISKDTFGRDVEVVGPPMGTVRSGYGQTAPTMTKPAGPVAP